MNFAEKKAEWEKTKTEIKKLKEQAKLEQIQGRIKNALLLEKYERKIKELKEKLAKKTKSND